MLALLCSANPNRGFYLIIDLLSLGNEADLVFRLAVGDLTGAPLPAIGAETVDGIMLLVGLFAAIFFAEGLWVPVVFLTTNFLGFTTLTVALVADDLPLVVVFFAAMVFALLLFAAGFLAVIFLAVVFLAAVFFAAVLVLLAAVFFVLLAAVDFLAVGFLAGALLAVALLATFFAVFTTRFTCLDFATCPANRSSRSLARLRSVSICPNVLANLINSCCIISPPCYAMTKPCRLLFT
ncbi:MAG: hypothetical protein AAF310_00460 [Myxococcota bacterium]